MEELWFTMLIGIPGCGKSTYISLQPKSKFGSIICPDSIRRSLTGDISDQSQNQLVWQIAQYTTKWALINLLSVTVDAVNTDTYLRRDFLQKLKNSGVYGGFKKRAIVFEIDPDEAIKRVEKRFNRPPVPPERIYKMYGEFLYTKKVLHEEEWDSIQFIGEKNG
jgi:predicted kinase